MTYKADWVTGDILTAAQQNALAEQAISRFADAAARDAAITSPTEGQFCYLTGTDALQFYDGSSWTASGTSWSGSTANGLATYGDASTIVSESTATYDGTTLALTTAGGGLKMDGLNSTNANTLDDYEEGTWTGTMVSAGGGTIGTDSATLGYVKIGKMVWCHGYFTCNAASSPTGTAQIHTLPFTAESGSTTMYALASFGIYNLATEEKSVMGTAQSGATHVFLRGSFGETGVYSGNSAEWFANAGSSNMQVSVNFCYRAST